MNGILKELIQPFGKLNTRSMYIILFLQVASIIFIWGALSGNLIPGPLDVLTSFFDMLSDTSVINDIIISTIMTFKAVLISIIIAAIIAYLSTVPLFFNLAKIVSNLRYLTLTGLIFVFTMMTNNAGTLKISLLLFGIIPFFVTSLVSIIDSIPKEEYNLCTTLKFNKWKTLYELVILGRLDSLIETIRQNFAISWLMITMVEGIAMSEGGIGTKLIKSAKYLHMSDVFALLFIVYIIGLLYDALFNRLRYWFFPYINKKL